MDKYQVIAPYLKHEESLSNIAEESGVPKRNLYHWVNQYQQSGLKGLIRRKRSDSGSFKVEENVQEEIKKLIFENKKNTLTSIHRKVCKICKKKNWAPPSYNQVYAIAKNLSPQLKELAHKGKKATLIGKYVVYLKLSIPITEVISLQIIWSKSQLI